MERSAPKQNRSARRLLSLLLALALAAALASPAFAAEEITGWEDPRCFPSARNAMFTVSAVASAKGTFESAILMIRDAKGNPVCAGEKDLGGVEASRRGLLFDFYTVTGVQLEPSTSYTWQVSLLFGDQYYDSPEYAFSTLDGSELHFGMDVSYAQGSIDWVQAAGHVDFAILRCGYSSDNVRNDDSRWAENVAAVEALGIPYGVYLYSYATTESLALSEAEHALRLLAGHSPTLPVFYDLEDDSAASMSAAEILKIATVFCDRIREAGYRVGVYSSKWWWDTMLTSPEYRSSPRWFAAFSGDYAKYCPDFDIWQYSEKGRVPGVSGYVDLDYAFSPLVTQEPTLQEPEPQEPQEHLRGDVNGDGRIDSDDAMLVLRYDVRKIGADALDLVAADVLFDGKVDSDDAMLILRYDVKKITEFPMG